MAIVQNPITGRSRKSYGNAVFSESYGRNTLRTKPFRVRDAQSPAQLATREKMRVLIHLVSQVVPVINEAYANTLTTMSPFNRVIGLNFKNAFTGEPPVLDHTLVSFCEFNGSMVNRLTLTPKENQVVSLEWDPNTVNEKELADPVSLIVINTTTNEALTLSLVAPRSAGSTFITVPSSWVGSSIAVHVITHDFVKRINNGPRMIIRFMAGADEASIIL